MFFKNLLSKFILIFVIFSVNNCFSMDFKDESRKPHTTNKASLKRVAVEKLPTTPKRRFFSKRSQQSDKENVEVDFNKAYLLQEAWATQDPKLLSPKSKISYTSLKQIYPYPIINPHVKSSIVNKQILYSPVARKTLPLKRRDMQRLKKEGLVHSLPANAFSEYTELPPETHEEKILRKQRELDYFLSINKIDYSTYQDLLQKEAARWIAYSNYIAAEKEKVLKGLRQKIRPEELEDIATATALQEYQSFKVGDTIFYYNLESIDFSFVDSFGRTNAQRLQEGLNPIGRDGLVMEVHHLTLFDDSIILVLLSRSCHDGHTLKEATQDPHATFHPQPTYYARGKNSDINRSAFAKIVTYICKKLGEMAPMSISKLPVYIPVDNLEIQKFLMLLDEEAAPEKLPPLLSDESSIVVSVPMTGVKENTTAMVTIAEDDGDSF